MKIIIKPSIKFCTAVGKEKGGRAICRRNHSMYIHNYPIRQLTKAKNHAILPTLKKESIHSE